MAERMDGGRADGARPVKAEAAYPGAATAQGLGREDSAGAAGGAAGRVAPAAGQPWRERLVQFGENDHLIGTVTVPVAFTPGASGSAAGVSREGAGKDSPSLGVVFLNAGVIHRIGPHRIHVKLARAVAEDGLPSLRVDLTGLGDSGRTRATDGMLAQACRDIRAAIDVLQAQTGVEKVVLSGICSGAEYGYQYAHEDARVAGLVMVDGYSFGNLRTKLLRWGLRLRTLTWPVFRNAVMGRIRKLRERGENDVPQTPVDYGLPVVTVEGFGHGLAERARAGCPTYLLFTGSVLQRYNHASQFADTMRAAPLADADRVRIREDVQCDFLPDIDHTMTTLHGQRVYVERVRQWLAGLRARQ